MKYKIRHKNIQGWPKKANILGLFPSGSLKQNGKNIKKTKTDKPRQEQHKESWKTK